MRAKSLMLSILGLAIGILLYKVVVNVVLESESVDAIDSKEEPY